MIRRLDPRTLTGGAFVAAGMASITAALLAAGPTRAHAAFVPPPQIWLTIRVSDSASGQYAPGQTVTITGVVANSKTTTTTTVSGFPSGQAFTTTAHPTINYSISTSAIAFVSAVPADGYTCTESFGQPACTKAVNKGVLDNNSTDTARVVFTVIGGPGDSANAIAFVHGNEGEQNHAGASAVATDTATVTNPGTYTNQAPPGCFVGKVSPGDQPVENGLVAFARQAQLVTSGTQTMSFTDGSIKITVFIPPGALPQGTLVTLYRAVAACWNSILASTTSSSHTQTIVDGYALGWNFSGSPTDAAFSVTLSVSDAHTSSGDPIFKSNKSGISGVAGTAPEDAWSVSFTDDPGFVLAQAAAAPTSTPSSPTSSASGTTTVGAPSGGGGPVARQTSPVPLAMGVLAIVGGVGLVGTRRRRRAR